MRVESEIELRLAFNLRQRRSCALRNAAVVVVGGPRMIHGCITDPYLDNVRPLPHEAIAPPNPLLDEGPAPGITNKS